MGKGKGQAEFSERVSISFKQSKIESSNSVLVAELIDFLDLKRSLGIHQQWIKQAILEQFLRERAGAGSMVSTNAVSVAPPSSPLVAKREDRHEAQDHVQQVPQEPNPAPSRRDSGRDVQPEQASATSNPRPKGLPQGMVSLMN